MLRRVCADAQARESFRYSHTQSMDVDEDSGQKLEGGFCAYAISTKSSCTGLNHHCIAGRARTSSFLFDFLAETIVRPAGHYLIKLPIRK